MSIFTDVSEHDSYGKTTRDFEVPSTYINDLYAKKFVDLPPELIAKHGARSGDNVLWPNQPVTLKAYGSTQGALALVSPNGQGLVPCQDNIENFGVAPRNKEQVHLFNLMANPNIRVMVVTGPAGTGKSLCIGSFALDQVLSDKKETVEKLIISKPLEIVTNSRFWGTVPGDENDKFAPFLKSFSIMFENMIGSGGKKYIETMVKNRAIEFLPLELMRGASLQSAITWYDEAQNLDAHEAATLGTRIDDVGGSKLFLSGDLNQRDRSIRRDETGFNILCNSPHFLRSNFTAHVDLRVIERGEIAELFHKVFEEDQD